MFRRTLFTGLTLCASFICALPQAQAAGPLTYRYKHFLFTVGPTQQAKWNTPWEVWTYADMTITPPQKLRVDGDRVPALPAGFSHHLVNGLNDQAIMHTIHDTIASQLNREAGKVTISRSASGAIAFDGVGLPGRSIDLPLAAQLTRQALRTGATDIVLPVVETQPTVTVTDAGLRDKGIKEVVTVGESNFDRSPANRRVNIKVGMAKFNGHIIPQGSIFSFDETLGRVDGTTGFLKELVIKGQRTEPDYGGGLCQVSTTAYRGIWEYGFPIVKRINHSYQVSHYFPQGTDATVYPPDVDMKFRNDSPGDLLMQTYADGDLAYFIYYGTRDDRKSLVMGPFLWGQTPPPPDKEELTLEIPPGEIKKVGEKVPGVKAAWFRIMRSGTGEHILATYSSYEARPLYHLVGVVQLPVTGSGAPTMNVGDF